MQELKQFLINVLDGRNLIISNISKDLKKKEQFQKMVDDLCLTEQSFEAKLKAIATFLLSNSKNNNGRLTSLLLFSMELDSFHSLNSSWYKRDMLIQTLYSILLDTKRIKREEYSFWEYTSFILFICSIVLIIIKKSK